MGPRVYLSGKRYSTTSCTKFLAEVGFVVQKVRPNNSNSISQGTITHLEKQPGSIYCLIVGKYTVYEEETIVKGLTLKKY